MVDLLIEPLHVSIDFTVEQLHRFGDVVNTRRNLLGKDVHLTTRFRVIIPHGREAVPHGREAIPHRCEAIPHRCEAVPHFGAELLEHQPDILVHGPDLTSVARPIHRA